MPSKTKIFIIYLLVYLFVICTLLDNLFIHLFTFNDPSQESSFLKEVGFLGRRRRLSRVAEIQKRKLGVTTHILDISFTVQRTQPGLSNIDQPITGHVYKKGVWLW